MPDPTELAAWLRGMDDANRLKHKMGYSVRDQRFAAAADTLERLARDLADANAEIERLRRATDSELHMGD